MHAFRPSLAISDGTTEAMAVHNLDPLDNSNIAIFNKILVRPLLSFGTAVASLDHVVKDRDGRGKYALGGVHKLNAVSGAGYMLVNREPFGIGLTAHSRLLITKDRGDGARMTDQDQQDQPEGARSMSAPVTRSSPATP